MFFPPTYDYLAGIVSIESPKRARMASERLWKVFQGAETRAKKLRIKRAVVLAANRARAMLKRRRLSSRERKELREVAKIYRNLAKRMTVPKR